MPSSFLPPAHLPLRVLRTCGAVRFNAHPTSLRFPSSCNEQVSLGVGAYRDDAGKPFVLESVRQAEKKILEKTMNMEDAGIDITIESKPSNRIARENDDSCTGGTGFGESCGVPFGVVLGPVGGVLVTVGILAHLKSKRGKHLSMIKPSSAIAGV